MTEAFNLIIEKIVGFAAWIFSLFTAVFTALWDLVKDAFSWVFDSLLGVVVSALAAIDVSAVSSYSAQGWGALPAELINILGLIGVGTAITIITAAIGIRIVLQLIPFVRLGS